MADSIPHQHYLPTYAHHKINKLVAKVGLRLRPAGPNAFKKIGSGKGKAKSKAGHAVRGGKK